MANLFANAVESVHNAAYLVVLSPKAAAGWCEQYAQEGYNVLHIMYPPGSDSQLRDELKATATHLEAVKGPFALIIFGLEQGQTASGISSILPQNQLRACIHYSPLTIEGGNLLIADASGRCIPTVIHIAASQEELHSSLVLLSQSIVPSASSAFDSSPLAFHAYPSVAASPPFLLMNKPPALVTTAGTSSVNPYLRSAGNLAYTRSLQLLRRQLGPHFDFETLWEKHTYYEFAERDALKTMSTMVKAPYVNHVPTMTGGIGFEDLARFYKYHFTGKDVTSPDMELVTVSRTIGADRLIDEMVVKFTHTTENDYFLPGVKPTGRPVELALVGVVAFRGDKLTFEHLYWDQASALVQVGLLDPKGLPVAGVEVARKVMDPFGLPSNTLMTRWKDSEGLEIK